MSVDEIISTSFICKNRDCVWNNFMADDGCINPNPRLTNINYCENAIIKRSIIYEFDDELFEIKE
jgi:hypothetical protein